jgi:predicted esterase
MNVYPFLKNGTKTLLMLMAVGGFSCKVQKNHSGLRAYSYGGQIKVSLKNSIAGADTKFWLVLSTPKAYEKLEFCAGESAESCVLSSDTYQNTSMIGQKGERKFFVAPKNIEIKDQGRYMIVARDTSNKIVDQRAMELTTTAPQDAPPVNDSATSPPTGALLSGGTGGRAGQFEYNVNGKRMWVKTLETSANDKGSGLLVLLHGSSLSNYQRFIGDMAEMAATNNLMMISVRAPNGSGWNEGNQTTSAEHLHQLIQTEVLTKYNIDKKRIYFSGQSSGAGFLSSHFIPRHGNEYQGGAFMQCGGSRPALRLNPSEEFKKNFKIHFEITTGDQIWQRAVTQTVTEYRAAGLTVNLSADKPGGHCAFDQGEVINKGLNP